MKVLNLTSIRNTRKLKFLLAIFYFLRSVILRGLVNTLRLGVLEVKHERKFGIRTADIRPSSDPRYYHYQGAAYHVSLRIFRDLAPGREHFHFIDIGCGKGRALIVAEHCGFRRLTGIELFPELLQEAARNVENFPMRRDASVITLLQANALDFEYPDEPAVYFLFNPFNGEVLRQVLLRIVQSTRAETYFVYMNPKFATVFAELGIKKQRVYKTRFYTEAIVFHLDKVV